MGSNDSGIPDNWVNSTLGDVCSQPQYGYTTKASNKGNLHLLRTTDITSRKITWETVPFCSDNPDDPEKYLLEDGDIVISRAGSVGVSYLIQKPERSVFASYLIRFKPFIDRKFFKYFLDGPLYWNAISENRLGIAVPNVNASKLKRISLPVPPLNEQRRIVAKLEELFSELDKGIESLKTAREQLKVYRQAVLKHAFEGKLTAKWREENKDKLESPEQLLARIQQEREARYQQQLEEWKAAVKAWEDGGKKGKKLGKPRALKQWAKLPDEVQSVLPSIPTCWVWEKLGWMTCGVEYGTAAKSSESGSVPVIRMGNIQNGMIDWQDLVFTSDEAEIEKYSLKSGDVLFNRTNSPELVGKTAIYRDERSALFAGYLIRVNHIASIVDSQYLNFFLNSYVAKQYGNTVKTDGVNQSNINGEKLQSYPFPYCSLTEQVEVVRVLEEKLSMTDRLMQDIDAELDKYHCINYGV
ncbi:restriction endonuclease subunit S [Nitrosococcus wardiae]|uniref:Restriction endonuclease subunit S n=1 Tax=Nitrosococcus wardiae TaxID=1814290 RepID=A0A4P7C4I2_9GAMM|nr:restriction endonuclease subunit S [Nitrosococcus wardiae]QBQ56657.1 restriction endonuclease subunit S [Nitrosococcus wardiae]